MLGTFCWGDKQNVRYYNPLIILFSIFMHYSSEWNTSGILKYITILRLFPTLYDFVIFIFLHFL